MLSDKAQRVAEKVKQLYDEQLRERLESSAHGRFVCIEPDGHAELIRQTAGVAISNAWLSPM